MQPIELTEEWLFRFGFLPIGYDFFDKGWFEVGYITTDEHLQFETEGGCLDIKSVHQLQNLFFALRKEELKLNEL